MSRFTDTSLPLFMDIRDRTCVVVGGTKAAERAALRLVEYGALVTVIAEEVTEPLAIMGDAGIVKLEKRSYRNGDLADSWLTIAADQDEDINAYAYREAEDLKRPVHVDTEAGESIIEIPVTVKRDPLQIAISTNDAAPGFAERIKAELEEKYSPVYTDFTDLMGETRDLVDNSIYGTAQQRRAIYEDLLNSDLFERLEGGEYLDADYVFRTYVKSFLANEEQ